MTNKRSNSVAVMVSGGIDSFIAYRLFKALSNGYNDNKWTLPNFSSTETIDIQLGNVVPVAVSYNQPYYWKELAALTTLFKNEPIIDVQADLVSEDLNNVPTVENQVIRGRNLLMAFYGALVADVVLISSLETEMTPVSVADKQPFFYKQLSDLLTFAVNGRPTVVTTPFSQHTKSDIIKLALDNSFVTQQELAQTVSCYNPKYWNCGACSTCFKRAIAMINNDIPNDCHYDPFEDNQYGIQTCAEMREEFKLKGNDSRLYKGRYTWKRIQETDRALRKLGKLPIME